MGVLGNQDVLSAQGGRFRKLEKRIKWKSCLGGLGAMFRNRKDDGAFGGAWNQGSVGWGCEEGVLEKEVGNFHDMGNYGTGGKS